MMAGYRAASGRRSASGLVVVTTVVTGGDGRRVVDEAVDGMVAAAVGVVVTGEVTAALAQAVMSVTVVSGSGVEVGTVDVVSGRMIGGGTGLWALVGEMTSVPCQMLPEGVQRSVVRPIRLVRTARRAEVAALADLMTVAVQVVVVVGVVTELGMNALVAVATCLVGEMWQGVVSEAVVSGREGRVTQILPVIVNDQAGVV